MNLYGKYIGLAVLLITFLGCQDDAMVESVDYSQFASLPKTITVSLGDAESSSRLAYEEGTSSSLKYLKSESESDDVVCMNPYVSIEGTGQNLYATYKLKEGAGSSVATFELDAANSNWNDAYQFQNYYLYYGNGGGIKSDADFLNHSYETQTQNGNNDMGHIEGLHSVRAKVSFASNATFNTAYIDLSEGVEQSSCIKLELSGLPAAIIPTKVSLITLDANNYWVDSFGKYNYLTSWYGQQSDFKDDKLHRLSLNLSNFTSTQSITAYMMMSNRPVYLEVGSKLRVLVESNGKKYIADKTITGNKELKGGSYHILTIDSGWSEYNVTSSQDYSKDGIVETKQTASKGKGVDLVIMGDGYIDTDITDGTYRTHLEQACEDVFSVEPMKSLKDYFNVYYVTAVSENRQSIVPYSDNNGATGTGASTKFSTCFTPGGTGTGGNNSLVLEYAKKALSTNADERIKTAQVIVVINASCHAGTNHSHIDQNTDYGASWGIAYTPMNNPIDATGEARRLTMVHEAAGHGIGKLADEYGGNTYYTNPASVWSNLALYHQWGYDRNVDKYDGTITESTVYWKDLIPTYKTPEGLGVYHEGGAYTVAEDFCRPTENSVMRSQFTTGGDCFNAASRWAIWYRIMKLSGADSTPTVDEFISWDAEHPQVASKSAIMSSRSLNGILPLAPPVYHKGQWINGRFVEE